MKLMNIIFDYVIKYCAIIFIIISIVFLPSDFKFPYLLVGIFFFSILILFNNNCEKKYIQSVLLKPFIFVLLTSYISRLFILIIEPNSFIRITNELLVFDTLLSYKFLLNSFVLLSLIIFSNYIFLKLYPEKIISVRTIKVRNENILFYVLISFLISRVILQYFLGWSHGGGPYRLGWLSNLIPFSIILPISFMLYYKNDNFKLKKLIIIIFLYSLISITVGSRFFLYAIVINLIFFTYFNQIKFDYHVSFTKFFFYLILFLFLSISLWILTNFIRGHLETDLFLNIIGIVIRLGAPIDNLYFILNSNSLQFEQISNVFWDIDIIKRSINSILPGSIFSTSSYPAGQVFKTIFFDENINSNMGDVWSGLGYLYAGFKYFAIVFYMLMFYFIYTILRIKSSGLISNIMIVYLAFYFSTTFHTIGMMENFIQDSVSFLVQLAIFYFIYLFISLIYKFSKIESSY